MRRSFSAIDNAFAFTTAPDAIGDKLIAIASAKTLAYENAAAAWAGARPS